MAIALTVPGARNFMIGGGVVYALLWLCGLLIDHDSPANFVPVTTADNWLHLVLAVGMIALGVRLGPDVSAGTTDERHAAHGEEGSGEPGEGAGDESGEGGAGDEIGGGG